MIKRLVLSTFFVLGLLFGASSVAGAAEEDCGASPQTCTPTDTVPAVGGQPIEGVAGGVDEAVKGRQQLPVTGAETVTIALGGAALVLAGGLMLRRSNRVEA